MTKAPIVGVVGAGPSVRMLYSAAIALGISIRVMASSRDDSAGSVVSDVTVADSASTDLLNQFAATVDLLVTIDEAPMIDGIVVLLARSPHGQVVVYPTVIVESLRISTVTGLDGELINRLQRAALNAVAEEQAVGLVAVTFDRTTLKISQVWRGPHPAGVWTIDGSRTSQYEQHLRAILDLPLGSPELASQQVMSEIVLGGDKPDLFRPFLHLFARDPALRIYLYGVPVEQDRAMGHVTVLGEDAEDLRVRVEHAAGYLNGRIDE